MSKRVLAGGPARETSSDVFNAHRAGLLAQEGIDQIRVHHVAVPDPGGPRWTHEKFGLVAQARQSLMERARLGWGALWLVDSDVIVGPGVLRRLWEVDADVVHGVFWTDCDWGGEWGRWPQVWDRNPYSWNSQTMVSLIQSGVNEVEVLGGGACTLIRRRGFESHYWPLLRSFEGSPTMMAGEDRTYCLGLECRGIRQVAVTGLPIEHRYDS